MPARRRRPVLYEVARRDRSSDPSRKERPVPRRPEPDQPPAAPSHDAAKPAASTGTLQTAPFFRVTNERVQLSLAWPAVAVLLAACVVALAVSFHAGRRYGQRKTTPAENARAPADLRPAGDLAAGDAAAGAGAAHGTTEEGARYETGERVRQTASAQPRGAAGKAPSQQTAPVQLKRGYDYVFIQFFPKSKLKEARDAAAFLRRNGLACTIQQAKNDIRLIATEAFLLDQKDAAARQREKQRCEELKRRVKQLGKEYARAGGGYAFDQCFERRISE